MSARALLAAAFLSAALAAVPAAARAVTFVVDSTVDAVDASPGDGVCADTTGACTLRAAVQEANALAGADEIELPAGTYTLTIPPAALGAGGALHVSDVTGGLILRGAGSDVTTIDAAGMDPVFRIVFSSFIGVPIELNGVAITGGTQGIESWSAALTLFDVDIHGNASSVSGGGLFLFATEASLMDSSVRANVTAGAGGGILATTGSSLSVSRSTVFGNSAGVSGGGIYLDGGVTLTNSTVSGNAAPSGGGLYHECSLPPCGGRVTLSNTTITGNQGGGIEAYLSSDDVFTAAGSIVALQLTGQDCRGDTFTSTRYNIDSDGSCNLTDPTDLPNTDPLLGPLQDNGGPTPTHALQRGSPAIDAIPAVGCFLWQLLGEDQRGVARPLTGDGAPPTGCDIGAYEVTQCADGLHNDADGRIDFDGGVTAGLPPEEQTEPDLQCVGPLDKREKSRCGLGFELVLVLSLLLGRRHVAAQATATSR